MSVLRKIFLFLLLGLLAVSCSAKEEVSSYQKTTEQNGIVPFGNELQQSSSGSAISNNLFDGFAVEQNNLGAQQNLSASETRAKAAATIETTVPGRDLADPNSVPSNSVSPSLDPTPEAPKATVSPSTTLNPATTQKPLLPVTFKHANSHISISSNTNEPRLSIQVSASCEPGQEYFVEASVYRNGDFLFTSSGPPVCAVSLAYFKSIPIDYVEGASYSVNYKISQNGKTLAETSAPTSIFL